MANLEREPGSNQQLVTTEVVTNKIATARTQGEIIEADVAVLGKHRPLLVHAHLEAANELVEQHCIVSFAQRTSACSKIAVEESRAEP